MARFSHCRGTRCARRRHHAARVDPGAAQAVLPGLTSRSTSAAHGLGHFSADKLYPGRRGASSKSDVTASVRSHERPLTAHPPPCRPSRRRSPHPADSGHSGLGTGTALHAPWRSSLHIVGSLNTHHSSADGRRGQVDWGWSVEQTLRGESRCALWNAGCRWERTLSGERVERRLAAILEPSGAEPPCNEGLLSEMLMCRRNPHPIPQPVRSNR
jgi:hypothetical protein